jgi:hypothetical protein
MKRRHFLTGSLLAAGALPGSQSSGASGFAPLRAEHWKDMRLLFLDAGTLSDRVGVELKPPPLEKLGPLIQPDSPGDDRGVIGAMGCGIVRDTAGHIRLYYSGRSAGEPHGAICIAESEDGIRWVKPKLGQVRVSGQDTNALRIEGVPADADTTQPSLVQLKDGRWRMYFWAHVQKPAHYGRYVAAESADGIHFRVVNFENPCLRHPSDIGKWAWLDGPESRRQARAAGLTDAAALALERVRTNDAVHTYADPSGGYEMFSVFPLPNSDAIGRSVHHDNAPFMLRVITRRTIEDGLVWSDPEFVAVPDASDPWDQQFYYLAQHRLDYLRIGFMGHYRVWDQTMDIEMTYSTDGHRWHRPMRGAWLPRGPEGSPDSMMVYMPTHLIDRGDHWLGLYSGTNATHNKYATGKHAIHGVKIPRYRFAGLSSSASLTARVRTQPFFLSGPQLRLDAAVKGRLRAELCNSFGQPLPGFTFDRCAPVGGDSTAHELRWDGADVADYRSYAASLRLEWIDGMVYGIYA